MKNNKIKLWISYIKAEAGEDVYITRLKEALKTLDYQSNVSSLLHKLQYFLRLLKGVIPPNGTNISFASTWASSAFKGKNMALTDFPWLTTTDSAHKQPKVTTYSVYHGNSWRAKNIPFVFIEYHCVFDPAYLPYRNK